jgi:hypothetical protein
MGTLLSCRYCNAPVKRANLASHQSQRCPSRPRKAKTRKAVTHAPIDACLLDKGDLEYTLRSGKHRCPDCFDWIPATQMQRHFQDHRFDTIRLKSPGGTASEWRGCLHCADIFHGPEQMTNHLIEMHPLAKLSVNNIHGRIMLSDHIDQAISKTSNIPTWKNIVRPDPAADLKKCAEPKQKQSLDGTKLYATSYRERGKFGSHSEHDDHGEEALP